MTLLEPVPLGPVAAPNRLLFGPHVTNLGRRRALTARHTAYYERRMAGGCGVVVVEEAAVHESDWSYEYSPLATNCGPGWAAIAAAAARHGSIALAALGHTGGQGSSAYSQRELWAPSGVPEVNSREVPKVMEQADIDAVVAGFADAAALAVRSGLHGVEINAGQHSLVRQFLSGLTNTRGDGYGDDKLRFAREVLIAVRSAIGPDKVLALRLSCEEFAPWAGLTPDSAAEVAAALADHVDVLVVVAGSIFSVQATRPDTHVPAGFNADLVAQVRAAVDPRVKVVAQGSIVDVAMAEQLLAEGRCELVEMTRAQIADAELATKAADDPATIRPCILCNQTCQVRDARNPIVSCVVDPRSGHETTDPDVAVGAPSSPSDVWVVGGGVTGLEAARVLASRGHRVRLTERSPALGGVIRLGAAAAGRAPLARIADWLEAECRRLGVDVRTGTDATPAEVEAASAAGTRIVLATGGHDLPPRPSITIADDAVVVPVARVLEAVAAGDRHGGLPSGPILIDDPIGGPIGVSMAETLAHAGRHVELATPDVIAGQLLSRSGDLAPGNVRLAQIGVTIHKRVVLRSVDAAGAHLEDRYTGERTVVPCAAVIDAGHRVPDDALWEATGSRHARAGDAIAPRTVYEAVLEARRAALAVEGIGPDPGHGTTALAGATTGTTGTTAGGH